MDTPGWSGFSGARGRRRAWPHWNILQLHFLGLTSLLFLLLGLVGTATSTTTTTRTVSAAKAGFSGIRTAAPSNTSLRNIEDENGKQLIASAFAVHYPGSAPRLSPRPHLPDLSVLCVELRSCLGNKSCSTVCGCCWRRSGQRKF